MTIVELLSENVNVDVAGSHVFTVGASTATASRATIKQVNTS
jgi:hypothetical protein